MSGTKRSPPKDFPQSKRSKLLNKNNINSSEMNSHLVGTSKNGLNSKISKPLAKPAGAINHTKPTTKKLVIKNLKGMLMALNNYKIASSIDLITTLPVIYRTTCQVG